MLPPINLGKSRLYRIDLPHNGWHDIDRFFLTCSWPAFLAGLGVLFLAAHSVFALAYLVDSGGIANARPGSFSDAFFFSIETMATVGQATMIPKSLYSHIVSTVEIVTGVLGFSVATALIVARFSRPIPCVLFSRVAVVHSFNGVPALMIRVASKHNRLVLEAAVQMKLLLDGATLEGDRLLPFHDLKVAQDHTPVLVLSWTVIHVIDESSPLFGRTSASLGDCTMIVTLSGLDERTLQSVHAHKVYHASDIRWGAQFADPFRTAPDGRRRLDFRRFHEIDRPGSQQHDPVHPEAALLSLPRLLATFLKLGTIGFGGGMAVMALMEREFVQKRRQLAADEFLHAVGLSEILGSFAPNMAFFLGYRLHGLAGALASVAAFLLPSVTIVILLAHLYGRYHAAPALQGFMAGLGPVVIALIVAASWSLGRQVLSGWPAWLLAVGGAVAGSCGINAVWVLLAAGLIGLLIKQERLAKNAGRQPASSSDTAAPTMRSTHGLAVTALPTVGAAMAPASLAAVGLTFFKIGLVFFGGGFVLVPVLHQQLVERLQWLTPQQFLDGVAISNLTPGPVAVLATFAGYQLQGVPGALLATTTLLAPAMALMTIICLAYKRLKESSHTRDWLAAVSPTVVGLVTSAALLLWPSAVPSWRAMLLVGAALVLLVRFRWPPVPVLAIGALLAAAGMLP